MVMRDAWVEIDQKKLTHNFLQVRQAVGKKVKICAVLKAQCYGMSAPQLAKVFSSFGEDSADAFAVATLGEALEVRQVIPDKEILVLGYLSQWGYDCAIKNKISLTMYREEALLELNEHAKSLNETAYVHIKVNSGMNRLGFLPSEESADTISRVMKLPNVRVCGIFTHLATADEASPEGVKMQITRFDHFLDMLKIRNIKLPTIHVAASASICSYPELDRDMVRPGLLLTGYYASDEVKRDRVWLQPCVKVKARLGNVMTIKKGEGISYGFTHRVAKDTVIGLLPLGFSDGFTRAFSNRFFVTIRGHLCQVIGNICMDHCVIDLSNVPNPQIGEEIVVYGDGVNGQDRAMNILEVAELRGTIPDEVLTNLSSRLPRKLV